MNKLPNMWWVKPNNERERKLLADWFNKGLGKVKEYTPSQTTIGMYYPNFDNFDGFLTGGHSGAKSNKHPYNMYTEISFKDFEEYILNKEKNKEIIGYKAPFDMYNGEIKKGDIIKNKRLSNGIVHYYIHLRHQTIEIVKEIVETWEPIYENIFITSRGYKVKKGRDVISIGDLNLAILQWNKIEYSFKPPGLVEEIKIVDKVLSREDLIAICNLEITK